MCHPSSARPWSRRGATPSLGHSRFAQNFQNWTVPIRTTKADSAVDEEALEDAVDLVDEVDLAAAEEDSAAVVDSAAASATAVVAADTEAVMADSAVDEEEEEEVVVVATAVAVDVATRAKLFFFFCCLVLYSIVENTY